MRSFVSLAVASSFLLACSGQGSAPTATSSSTVADAAVDAGPTSPLVAARPYELLVPDSYDGSKGVPLLVMLHGYGAAGKLEELLMGISAAAQKYGFLYAYPDGTMDSRGKRFWNATDACCDFDLTGIDDVAYIDAVIDDVSAHYKVDANRVYLVGHSNGAFMANRFACDRASRIAAIVSLAGAQWKDASRCANSVPVAMVQVHGDKDDEILYDGGVNQDAKGGLHPYPSAHDTVATWAAKDGCSGALASVGPNLDIDNSIDGAETKREGYAGCAGGNDVQLWTMVGSGHVPGLGPTWGESIWSFLSAHAKNN